MPDRQFHHIVAGSRGVVVDSPQDGWSGPVAFGAEECEQIADEFVAMAEVLRSRPDILARWEATVRVQPEEYAGPVVTEDEVAMYEAVLDVEEANRGRRS